MDIDTLFSISNNLVRSASLDKTRYIYQKISWQTPMICVKGARGVGKTTLFFQRMKTAFEAGEALYVSLDSIWFSNNRLIDLIDYHYNHGGKAVFLDEVHRYPYDNWAQELKNIYDSYPGYQIAFTGSSLLKIDMSKADLSRRCVFYDMQGMSFREYLSFYNIAQLPSYSLEDILERHTEIEQEVLAAVKPLQYFDNYLHHGYYPFYDKYQDTYAVTLQQIINTIIDSDLQSALNVENITVNKFKRLLFIISQNVPFTPNISKIAQGIESNRPQTYSMLSTLDQAALINNLYSGKDTMQQLNKPEKIYMENTNLLYALTKHPTEGNLRETFFANQLKNDHEITFSGEGDFMIDGKYTIEVGGRRKSFQQIKDLPNSYLAIDDVESAVGNKVPLWLFGFLY
ncbi:MAG: AAA family ATPase [Prevotella sp.]|nr:AAA family ATPase [Prevotella sp.]